MPRPAILLFGAKGRMGTAILAKATQLGFPIAGAVDADENPLEHIEGADVIIDFSHHSATESVIDLAISKGKALVIGTTGHSAEERARLAEKAERVACVWAGNFSIGVNLLNHLVREAARSLGDEFDVELVEMHHRLKKDAPSGTAETLLRIIREEKDLPSSAITHGRSGITGERSSREIGVHALRGGDVVGDHTIIFAGPGERLEMSHKASTREIFAAGALRAAEWISGREPGIRDMSDVLGFSDSRGTP